MTRQRVILRTSAVSYLVRTLTIVLAAGLFWYGLMVVLLAVKVSPHTVDSLSAYRILYHDAAGLTASDFTTTRRLIAGFAGLIAFVILMYLAIQMWPRPYLARGEVELSDDERGSVLVAPRAIERVAEVAARGNPDVTAAAGRLGDQQLNIAIDSKRASSPASTLRDVHHRVRDALARHELPSLPVSVTLAGYDRQTRRELS